MKYAKVFVLTNTSKFAFVRYTEIRSNLDSYHFIKKISPVHILPTVTYIHLEQGEQKPPTPSTP